MCNFHPTRGVQFSPPQPPLLVRYATSYTALANCPEVDVQLSPYPCMCNFYFSHQAPTSLIVTCATSSAAQRTSKQSICNFFLTWLYKFHCWHWAPTTPAIEIWNLVGYAIQLPSSRGATLIASLDECLTSLQRHAACLQHRHPSSLH